MKIVITGICGFVGSTLARAWLEGEPALVICGMGNFNRPELSGYA
jgi:CDP-paratose 2-epimerase